MDIISLMLIQNVKIIDAYTEKCVDVLIEEGKIAEILPPQTGVSEEVVDGTGKILFPGLIDPHVHFREPGFEYKEDLESGSSAAVSAGVTGFFDMPNTNPPTFTRELLAAKKDLARGRSWAHFGFYFGAGPDNKSEIEAVEGVPGTKLYLNTTTGNLKMDQEDQWRAIFRIGKPVSLHAEGETFHRAVSIWVEEEAPCKLHLCHASLRSEVELVRKIKTDQFMGPKISMEVCPHHLFMTHEDRERYGAFCCMKPELATQDDVEALWEGVADTTVDMFATDHAPHTKAEKMSDQIYYGIPGVETLFHLLYTEFVTRGMPLSLLAAMTSHNVFQQFKVSDQKGLIAPGYDADLVLVDPEWEGVIDASKFFSKCDWTPFEGRTIRGGIETVWLNGSVVFEAGILQGLPRGQELGFGR